MKNNLMDSLEIAVASSMSSNVQDLPRYLKDPRRSSDSSVDLYPTQSTLLYSQNEGLCLISSSNVRKQAYGSQNLLLKRSATRLFLGGSLIYSIYHNVSFGVISRRPPSSVRTCKKCFLTLLVCTRTLFELLHSDESNFLFFFPCCL